MTETKSGAPQEDGSTKGDQPVTISAPPAAAVTIDPQNPLPEPSFLHRRIIAYIVVLAVLGLCWHAAEAFHDLKAGAELLILSKWIIGFGGLIATYYYIAPSAAELTNLIQSAKIIRSGLDMAGKSRGDANEASERRLDRAESRAERRSQRAVAGDGRFSEDTLSGPENGPCDDSEIDYAPTGRSYRD